jgi:hypothetical protein
MIILPSEKMVVMVIITASGPSSPFKIRTFSHRRYETVEGAGDNGVEAETMVTGKSGRKAQI